MNRDKLDELENLVLLSLDVACGDDALSEEEHDRAVTLWAELAREARKTGNIVKMDDYFWHMKTHTDQIVLTEDGVHGTWNGVNVVCVDGAWYEDFEKRDDA